MHATSLPAKCTYDSILSVVELQVGCGAEEYKREITSKKNSVEGRILSYFTTKMMIE